MRILLTADPEIPVPPKLYGGIERIVDGLVSGYTKRGHEVYLLGHEDSTSTDALEIFSWQGKNSRSVKDTVMNARVLNNTAKEVKPDVIHQFSRLLYAYPLFFTSNIPVVMSYGRRISPYSTSLASFVAGNQLHFTSAANHMLDHLGSVKRKFSPIYNFTPTDFNVPLEQEEKREYVMFLGRLEEIKGVREAIESAIAAKQRIVIAGNISEGHEDYFEVNVKPFLDNELVEYVGPVDDEQKRYYLQRAKALLFPLKLKEEAFGMVMIEAMACGTPVIAFDLGPVPEIVKDGKNGFLVKDVQGMAEAISKLDSISRTHTRDFCENMFSLQVIADEYLELLTSVQKVKG